MCSDDQPLMSDSGFIAVFLTVNHKGVLPRFLYLRNLRLVCTTACMVLYYGMQHTKWGFVIFFNINDNRQIAAVTQLRDNGAISYYRVLLEPGIVHSTPPSRAHIYWPIRIQADGERAESRPDEILMPHIEYQVRHKLNCQ